MFSRWSYNNIMIRKTTDIAKLFKKLYLSNTDAEPEQILKEVISFRYRTSIKTLFRPDYLKLLSSAVDNDYFDGLYQFAFAIIFMEDQAIEFDELTKLHENIGEEVKEKMMKLGFGPEQLGNSSHISRSLYYALNF